MVVVVPAFAVGQRGDPPVVPRPLAGLVGLVAPNVRRRIDQPGAVPADDDPHENSPDDKRPPAGGKEEEPQDRLLEPVRPADEAMHRVGGKLRGIAPVLGGVVEYLVIGQEPEQVRPPETPVGAVRVLRPVGKGVVHAVSGHPFHRPALGRQCAADGQEVLQPFRRLEAPVRQQTVVAEGDAQADRDPMQAHEEPEGRPAERRGGEDQPQVQEADARQRRPLEGEPGSGGYFTQGD